MSGGGIVVAIVLLGLAVVAGPWWPRVWLGLTLSGAAVERAAAEARHSDNRCRRAHDRQKVLNVDFDAPERH